MIDNTSCDILITYRDRETHLRTLIPQLRKHFKKAHITVIEQKNDFKFYKSILYNVGIKNTKRDIVILTDVDYVPMESTTYYDGVSDLFLPVKHAEFVDNTMQPRPTERIPSGYRHFTTSVDDNFYGGVLTFKRDALIKINGFNPLYFGWGLEDADIGRRAQYYGLTINRNDAEHGGFYVMEHLDNFPGVTDSYFKWNNDIYASFTDKLQFGLHSFYAAFVTSPLKQEQYGVDQWIEVLSAEVVDG